LTGAGVFLVEVGEVQGSLRSAGFGAAQLDA
jgi:hypothetical protein